MKCCWIRCYFLLLYALSECSALSLSDYYKRRNFRCQPIQEKLCMGIGYNFTTMPNVMGNENQREASRRFKEFESLMNYQYSEKFRFLLCTLFFPMCTEEVNVGITACRPLCEDMRRERAPIMKLFEYEWSDSIDCSKLPWSSEENHLCIPHPSYMDDSEEVERTQSEDGDAQPPHGDPDGTGEEEDERNRAVEEVENVNVENEVEDIPEDVFESEFSPDFKNVLIPDVVDDVYRPPNTDDVEYNREKEQDYEVNQMINNGNDGRHNDDNEDDDHDDDDDDSDDDDEVNLESDPPLLGTDEIPAKTKTCFNSQKFIQVEESGKCIPRCGPEVDLLFNFDDKKLVYLILSFSAAFCYVATAVTIATFLVDPSRFRYPKRPVIMITICYNLYAVGYLMRTAKGFHSPFSCVHHEALNVSLLVTDGLKDTTCYASFFILYFFQMAASVWWVVLNLTWLLSSALKWGHEAIERVGFYFHIVAWTLPAIQTVLVLLRAGVDGDELTGFCNVGNLDPDSLMYFVIIPMTLYLLTGTVVLAFGFCYMFKIRRVIKDRSRKEVGNLEKLMMKIGLFSVLYAIPVACVLAVNYYQYQNFSRWMTAAKLSPCTPVDPLNRTPNQRYYKSPHNDALDREREDYNAQMGIDLYYPDVSIDFPSNQIFSPPVKVNRLVESASSLAENDVAVNCHLHRSLPSLSIFIIKIIMSLIPGVMTVMWIGSVKTINSWMMFFKSCTNRQKESLKVKQHPCNRNHYQRKEVIGLYDSDEDQFDVYKNVNGDGSYLSVDGALTTHSNLQQMIAHEREAYARAAALHRHKTPHSRIHSHRDDSFISGVATADDEVFYEEQFHHFLPQPAPRRACCADRYVANNHTNFYHCEYELQSVIAMGNHRHEHFIPHCHANQHHAKRKQPFLTCSANSHSPVKHCRSATNI